MLIHSRFRRFFYTNVWLVIALSCAGVHAATGTDVTLHVTLTDSTGKGEIPSAQSPVIAWLVPVDAAGAYALQPPPGAGQTFQMAQKNKMFVPHLLVIPVGATVSFPNRDPFFHNVFSLFNGKRFDLGLYEGSNSHAVPFTREGVSYIFCNIHPEMGAVILSVDTPYFAIGTQASVQLSHVPAGEYVLKLWAEDAAPESLAAASRTIRVHGPLLDLGALQISLQPRTAHMNKFGEPYSKKRESNTPY